MKLFRAQFRGIPVLTQGEQAVSAEATAALPEYEAKGQKVLEDAYSEYQHIVIAEDPDHGRILYLDEDLQIAESDHNYNDAMVRPLVETESLGEVLILGGGDGGVLKAVVDKGAEHATMVDIDEKVVELSREYLPALCADVFEHDEADLIIGDAFAYLDKPRRYDAIIYDLTMEPVREDQSHGEFMEEIFGKGAKHLRDDGVFSMQCCSEHQPELRMEIRRRLGHHFDEVEDRVVTVPSYGERWIFASAARPR